MVDDLDLLKLDQGDSKSESPLSLGCATTKSFNDSAAKVPSGQIILRTMMQKIVFRIYPNGQTYIDKAQCSTWFTDQKQIYKPKQKKKANEVKKAKMKKEEVY